MLPSQNFDAHLFHVVKNMISMIFNGFNDFMVFGRKAPGAHGTLLVCDILKNYFMVWDLSKSVCMVFRSTGNPIHQICSLYI